MNSKKRNCRLSFKRVVNTVNPTTGRKVPSEQLVVNDWPFLFEAMTSKTKTSLIGRIDRAAAHLTWSGTINLEDGDFCEYAGKTYVFREPLADVHRPNKRYTTGYLQEQKCS